MDLLLKILKITALLALVLVLAVLFSPTLKGPFVIIHFTTALRAWILAQGILFGLVTAAHLLIGLRRLPIAPFRHDCPPLHSAVSPAFEPLRC